MSEPRCLQLRIKLDTRSLDRVDPIGRKLLLKPRDIRDQRIPPGNDWRERVHPRLGNPDERFCFPSLNLRFARLGYGCNLKTFRVEGRLPLIQIASTIKHCCLTLLQFSKARGVPIRESEIRIRFARRKRRFPRSNGCLADSQCFLSDHVQLSFGGSCVTSGRITRDHRSFCRFPGTPCFFLTSPL
jgi:hypothetical protein